MRSPDQQQLGMFSYVSVEQRVPADHPIRKLRVLVDTILAGLDAEFSSRYAKHGRPSIPPERLLRAALLQVVYSVRSERLLMEQMDYNLLFRWFVGLNIDDPVWDHSTFSFNRDRLFDAEIAQHFFQHTVLLARVNELVSDEHFSVDGTLLEAWASHKSFRPKDGDDDGRGDDFRGRPRSNDTHASTTDPDARLMRKGKGKEYTWMASPTPKAFDNTSEKPAIRLPSVSCAASPATTDATPAPASNAVPMVRSCGTRCAYNTSAIR